MFSGSQVLILERFYTLLFWLALFGGAISSQLKKFL